MEQLNVRKSCEYINHVAGLLRTNGHLVVHIQDMEGSEEDPDTEARNIIPEIIVGSDDLRLEKQFSNAFWETDLEQLLRKNNVEFLIIAGFAAEQCVTFTANGAVERGFQAALLQHGIVSRHPDAITAAYRDRHIISYPVVEFLMSTVL